jgi:hypothetical protein
MCDHFRPTWRIPPSRRVTTCDKESRLDGYVMATLAERP